MRKYKILAFVLLFFAFSCFGQNKKNQFTADGKPDGYWETYYENSGNSKPIKEYGYYKNGLKNGKWILLTVHGGEGGVTTYSMGKKNGIEKIYFENGNGPIKSIKFWKNDLLDGVYTEYAYNYSLTAPPQPYFVTSYQDGLKEGKSQTFYQHGELKEEVWFHRGKLHGDAMGYTEGGQFTYKAKYENGEARFYNKF